MTSRLLMHCPVCVWLTGTCTSHGAGYKGLCLDTHLVDYFLMPTSIGDRVKQLVFVQEPSAMDVMSPRELSNALTYKPWERPTCTLDYTWLKMRKHTSSILPNFVCVCRVGFWGPTTPISMYYQGPKYYHHFDFKKQGVDACLWHTCWPYLLVDVQTNLFVEGHHQQYIWHNHVLRASQLSVIVSTVVVRILICSRFWLSD